MRTTNRLPPNSALDSVTAMECRDRILDPALLKRLLLVVVVVAVFTSACGEDEKQPQSSTTVSMDFTRSGGF